MNNSDQPIVVTPDSAFHNSTSYEFAGKPLHPYSFLRHTAAMALGLKYWKMSADDIEHIKNPKPFADRGPDEPETIDMYAGILTDTAIVLWLMSQDDATCRAARRNPREFEAVIDEWAEANGLMFGDERMTEGVGVFMDVFNDMNATRPRPTQAEQEGGYAPEEMGNP